ncbi:MAG TPA: hypothetical protein VIN04_07320 [Myxococcota bacterium]
MSELRRRRSVRLLALAGLAALAACANGAQFVQVQRAPDQPLAIGRLAVVPFRAVERPGAPPLPDDAAPLVGGYVASAFEARGLEVVPPSDVAQGLDLAIVPGEPLEVARVAAAAHEKFGVDAIVIGSVHRFVDRSGEAMGSTHPASVGFELRVLAAPSGAVLWAGAFDETQVALGDNLLRAPQYPGGGMRWLTAEELARWGAGLVANQVPIARTAAANP